MKDRLKQIRLKLGYNLVQMAEKLQIEANTYKGYEYKTKNLPCDFLILLIKKLNVNTNWLLTGEGEMFNNQENNILNDEPEIKKIIYDTMFQILKNNGYIKQ